MDIKSGHCMMIIVSKFQVFTVNGTQVTLYINVRRLMKVSKISKYAVPQFSFLPERLMGMMDIIFGRSLI